MKITRVYASREGASHKTRHVEPRERHPVLIILD
jgi:hypothetical protein